jgi:hypothetical protein
LKKEILQMNMPISTDEKRRLIVNTDEFLILVGITSKQSRAMRESGDYAESNAGRERRQERRNAIARKREFLA